MTNTSQSKSANDQSVLAFTSVSRNKDGASFGAVIRTDSAWFALAERAEFLTPNAMELIGACRVLDRLRTHLGPVPVRLFVSEYVSKGYTLYFPQWDANNWRSKSGEIAHCDLWKDLDRAARTFEDVSFESLPSKGPDKMLWHRERTAAAKLATSVTLLGYSWQDVTKAFRPRFDLALLNSANDNDPRDGR